MLVRNFPVFPWLTLSKKMPTGKGDFCVVKTIPIILKSIGKVFMLKIIDFVEDFP